MTKAVTRFLSSIIALFVAAAVGCMVYIFMNREDSISTVEVSLVSVDVGIDISGTIVRDETLIMQNAGQGYSALVRSGERVSAGQAIIAVFDSREKAEAYAALDKLSSKYDILTEFTSGNGSNDVTLYNAEIFSALTDCAKIVSGYNTGKTVSDVTDGLETALLRKEYSGYTADELSAVLAKLSQTRASLRDVIGYSDSEYITSDVSGFYVAVADGWENLLTPERLLASSYEEFEELLHFTPEAVTIENCCGKVISGSGWYLAATVSAADSTYFNSGIEYTVKIGNERVKMSVSSLVKSQDGRSVLAVFYSKTALSDVTLSRFKDAVVVFDTYEGFRVPADGMHIENGKSGVYVLEGAQAVFKEVDILYSEGSYYIVKADYEDRGNLFNGDMIIIGEKDLYDGKMMK